MTEDRSVFNDPYTFPIDKSSIRRSAPQLAMDEKLSPVITARDTYPIRGTAGDTSYPINREPVRVASGGAIVDTRQTFKLSHSPKTSADSVPTAKKGTSMTPEQLEIATRYMMERLQPEEREELKALLGGEEEMPDTIAEDAAKGKIAMDRLPPRLKRVAIRRMTEKSTAASEADFYERYPDARRLKI